MKTCIISGASSGIGRATAIAISKQAEYDNIVIISRRQEALLETRNQMDTERCNIHLVPYDLSDLSGIPNLIKGIAENYGQIDALINISGYTEPAALLDTTFENMELTFSLNVFSVLILIRECTKYMMNCGGRILNVASTAGSTSRPGWVSYAASKAAVISMSKTLSAELSEYGIKVYCVSPGRCATPLRRILAPEEDQSKIMQPEMVADVICDLMNEKGICLDGQDIVIRMQT